jgi:hypothetical protein
MPPILPALSQGQATPILAPFRAVDVADAIAVAAPHKSFFFSNDQGGPLPSYRGLSREQATIVGILERQLARLANIIEEARNENKP